MVQGFLWESNSWWDLLMKFANDPVCPPQMPHPLFCLSQTFLFSCSAFFVKSFPACASPSGAGHAPSSVPKLDHVQSLIDCASRAVLVSVPLSLFAPRLWAPWSWGCVPSISAVPFIPFHHQAGLNAPNESETMSLCLSPVCPYSNIHRNCRPTYFCAVHSCVWIFCHVESHAVCFSG